MARWLTGLLVLAGSSAWSQEAPAAAKPGQETQVRFQTRHPLSSWAALKERIPFGAKRLASSSFQVRLPKGYRPRRKKTYGLVVWMSPDTTGRCPPAWAGELRRQRLILIGPDAAGNDQPLAQRVALALDALQGALTHYRVDPQRVFAMGFSGGGNVTSWLGLHFPELFAGTALLSGCDTFRPVPIPDRPDAFWLRIAPGLGHRPCSGPEMRRVLEALEAPAEPTPKPSPSPPPASRPAR